jgi:CelD/BcsL family acetyltransferase involved in cellulose biosynthesis
MTEPVESQQPTTPHQPLPRGASSFSSAAGSPGFLSPPGEDALFRASDEAPDAAEALRVEEVRDLAGFDALAPEWNALVARTDDQLFYRHEFLRCWLTHFAPDAALRVLTGRDAEGRLVAALALREERTTQFGLPVRQLSSPSNPHSCRFDMLAEQPRQAGTAFLTHLARDPGWDVLRLADVPDGGAAWGLLRAAEARGLPVGTWLSARSPYLLLPATMEDWKGGPGYNPKSLRRRRRRLSEQGEVRIVHVSGREGLEAWLAEGFAVERSGWKARRGTAIAQDPRTLGFYSELARLAADTGRLSLYFLRLGEKTIAFQFGLAHAGRYLALKPGYDEAFAQVSPGQLLTESLIQDCIARGLGELDLLGDDTPHKREWTDRVRVHHWLFMFRDTLVGRTLCSAKFRWVPLAKRMVKRWSRAH